ncbi:hypothetical protein SASPL_105280 [Salvia splendens]|uniref:Late embryogenesis abundant protein LEA-2 subgroup domain-containing protein n=1 Tax=Salvia splendens TaxID=180675 RepID=A0A8X8YIQ5_SALSN|nr:uncharacterized protein LOC121777219 [Salvia splendens]KAG6433665.1 hypothetical protein SASPL_105280 [Salvia splendens]
METESSSRKLMEADSAKSPGCGRRGRRICLCASAAVLGLGLLLLILGLTVFKARRPTTRVDSVALDDLDFSLDLARLRVAVNVTLALGLTVHNPNRVGFKYRNGTALLRHRGNDIGEVPVPAGRIGARDTRSLNLTLALMADRIVSDSAMFNDFVSGTLPIQAYVKLSGKVRIVFSIHVATYTTCDVDVMLRNQTLSNLKCHYRTKL